MLFLVLVTISKKQTSDPDFKGYLCQVRQVGQTATFGTFTPRDTTKSRLLNCIRANVSWRFNKYIVSNYYPCTRMLELAATNWQQLISLLSISSADRMLHHYHHHLV